MSRSDAPRKGKLEGTALLLQALPEGFFPQSKELGTDLDANVSPGILKEMVYAGARLRSFPKPAAI